MTRLLATDINGNVHELDMYGNENVNITLQIDDIRNIESKKGSFSKTFNIPATKKNNKFFDTFNNVDRYKFNFDVYKNSTAQLFVNEVLVLEGFLKLNNTIDKNTEISYEIVLFNDVVNIIETLADSTINNLDLTDIRHEFNTTNIQQSWLTNQVFLNEGGTTDNVYYTLTNDGNLYFDNDDLVVNFDNHYMLNVKLLYIVNKIFAFAGFEYSSNFFNSTEFSKIYFDCGRRVLGDDDSSEMIIATIGSGTHAAQGVFMGNSTPISNNYLNPTVIDFVNEVGDDNNEFNHNTSVYTATKDCKLDIKLTIRVNNEDTQENGFLVFFANGQQIGQVTLPDVTGGITAVEVVVFTGTIDVISGNTVTFQFVAFTGDMHINNSDAVLQIKVVDIGTDTMVKSNRGDIKLADILKDIVKAFNLSLESLGNNRLKIETYNDFLNDDIIDWTQKINLAETTVEPLDIPKRLVFNHAEDSKDYYAEMYEKTHFRKLGTQILEFDVDSTEVVEIKLNVFAAPFIQQLLNTNINIQHIATQNGDVLEGFDHKPRLIFKNQNNISAGFTTKEFAENGSSTLLAGSISDNVNSGVPYEDEASDSTDPLTTLTSDSSTLYFGTNNIVHTPNISTVPINTLFNKYWFTYITEKFNAANGKMLKAEFYLKPIDINTFSFASKVRVGEQIYRVNKIEYNTDINQLAKVELLRL